MEDYKLTVKAIAANLNIPIEELAERCGISPSHLKNVSSGRARMTADDIVALSNYTGIPEKNIVTSSNFFTQPVDGE